MRELIGDALPIPGFTGYFYKDDGSIWSSWKMQGAGYGKKGSKQVLSDTMKKLLPDKRPYDNRGRFTLKSDSGKYVRKYGHYFILLAEKGECPSGLEACHNNGNCLDNSPSNLRYDTHQSNINDKKSHGTQQFGNSINTAKLTEEIVKTIRSVGYPLKQHCDRYGITMANASLILKRKTWKHVAE